MFIVLTLLVLNLLLIPIISSNSIDSEMNKIAHYAEEYETGNIDYVKLMLYISSAREGLNEILGAKAKYIGRVVKQEKLKELLGEPNEKDRGEQEMEENKKEGKGEIPDSLNEGISGKVIWIS